MNKSINVWLGGASSNQRFPFRRGGEENGVYRCTNRRLSEGYFCPAKPVGNYRIVNLHSTKSTTGIYMHIDRPERKITASKGLNMANAKSRKAGADKIGRGANTRNEPPGGS